MQGFSQHLGDWKLPQEALALIGYPAPSKVSPFSKFRILGAGHQQVTTPLWLMVGDKCYTYEDVSLTTSDSSSNDWRMFNIFCLASRPRVTRVEWAPVHDEVHSEMVLHVFHGMDLKKTANCSFCKLFGLMHNDKRGKMVAACK